MEKNSLMIFENEQFGRIRTLNIDGTPWFVSADVCTALGISRTAVRRLDDDEKGVRSTHTPGGTQKLTVVNEFGLYNLILGSRKPEAKEFKRWITHEVIPSIRKHGAYMTDAVIEHLDENPELVSEYLHRLRDQNDSARELRERLNASRAENARLLPKADYYDSFVYADDLTCFRYTAKELGVPQKKLMGYLFEHNYLFRDRHRKGRAFAKAGKRNDPLFATRDFYTPTAEKSEYTLVTPAGKKHFKGLVSEISAWIPPEKRGEISEGELETNAAIFAK
jgi:prophage antirepressor-like protein